VQQRLGSVRLSRGSVDGGWGTRGRGETEAVPSATGAYSLEELGGAAECLAARAVASPDAPVEIQHEELALQPEELIAEKLLVAPAPLLPATSPMVAAAVLDFGVGGALLVVQVRLPSCRLRPSTWNLPAC